MRITIIQTEIEDAIRDMIRSQIQVQEGMEIDIDLRATRGAEGFQADIDIHPKGSKGSSRSPGPKTPPAPKGDSGPSSKPLKIEEAVTTAKAGKASKNTAPKNDEPKDELPKDEEAPAPTLVVDNEVATPVEAPEPAPEVAPVAKKPLSIFANKKSDAEEAPAADEAPKDEAPTQSIFGGLKRPVNA